MASVERVNRKREFLGNKVSKRGRIGYSLRSVIIATGLAINAVGCVPKPSAEDIERACTVLESVDSRREENGIQVIAEDPLEENMPIREQLEHVPTRDIIIYDTRDNSKKNITNSAEFDEDFPTLSSRGEIAFIRRGAPYVIENSTKTRRIDYASSDLAGIYIIRADGSGEELIAKMEQNETLLDYPAWSNDGTKLAFARMVGSGNEKHSNLYVYDLAAPSSLRKLTSYGGDVNNLIADISFSPDDREIAYIDWQGLHVVSLETGVDKKITAASDFDGESGRDENAYWISSYQLVVENVRRLNNGELSEDIQDPKDLFDRRFLITMKDGSGTVDITKECIGLNH